MLRLLGPQAHISVAGEQIRGMPVKGLLLAGILALTEGRVATRAHLADLLWEGSGPTLFANLRQLLANVRKCESESGEQLFVADKNHIWLRDEVRLDVDEIAALMGRMTRAELLAFIDPSRIEFLHGIAVANPTLQSWIEGARQRLSGEIFAQAETIALNWPTEERVELYARLLAVEPFDEKLFSIFATSLADADQRNKILLEWEHFRVGLSRELGVAPSEEVRRLITSLSGIEQTAGTGTAWAIGGRSIVAENFREGLGGVLPKLLVLPPDANLSQGTASEFACVNGLVEDVIDALATMRSFSVMAPHTARTLVRTGLQLPEVDYILTTRLQGGKQTQFGNRTIVLRLTACESGKVLLSDRMTLDAANALRRHHDMIAAVTSNIAASIDIETLSNLNEHGNADAYVHYLMGKERLRPFDLRNVRSKRKAFLRAIELDRNLVPARALLSRTLTMEWFLLFRKEKDLLIEADRLAAEVIREDPTYAGGHWERANARLYLNDLDGALEHARTARERAPHNADIVATHADTLIHNCAFREANNEIDAAIDLNPLAPDEYHWIKGSALFFNGRYEEAIATLNKSSNWTATSRLKAACHALLGEKTEATRWRKHFLKEYPDFETESWSDTIPLKSAEHRAFYVDALKSAGFH